MASLAELLDYDQRKRQMLDALQTGFNKSYSVADAFTHGLADQVGGVVGLMTTDPRETIGNLYNAGKAVVQNPRAAYQAAKEGLTEAVSSPQNIARFAGQNFNPLELANALNKVGTMRELTVYHGTPHTLPPTANNPLGEFDASKIGTGEGAAAYGHGVYVAQNPNVAKEYKKRLSDETFTTGKGEAFAPAELEHLNIRTIMRSGDLDAAITKAKEIIKKGQTGLPDRLQNSAIQMAKNDLSKLQEIKKTGGLSAHKGNLYTVDLPDEKIDQMLDWDKPLSEQPKNVQQTLAKLDPDTFHPNGSDYAPEELGQMIYNRLANSSLAKNQAEVSSLLKLHGIPGIKYLDEGSRSKSYQIQLSVKGKPYETDPIMFATKEQADKAAKDYAAKGFTADVKNVGTRNFVVFPGEEKSLKILSRE